MFSSVSVLPVCRGTGTVLVGSRDYLGGGTTKAAVNVRRETFIPTDIDTTSC